MMPQIQAYDKEGNKIFYVDSQGFNRAKRTEKVDKIEIDCGKDIYRGTIKHTMEVRTLDNTQINIPHKVTIP
jgi:hypothetical protein